MPADIYRVVLPSEEEGKDTVIYAIKAVIVATFMALVVSACGSHQMASIPQPTGTSGASAADAMFAQMMIPHHEQAVEMARLAETRASSPEIKKLASDILSGQEEEIDLMKSWLGEWGVPLLSEEEADGLADWHWGMISKEQLKSLEEASGSAFDRLFAEYMILHHEGTISMAEDVADSKEPRVSTLAKEIIVVQLQEITQLETFLDA